MIYTYLIQSNSDQNFYTGISENPDRRLLEHNSGKLKMTASKRPWRLIYYKNHLDYAEARIHEKWLKKKSRSYKESIAQLVPPWSIGGMK